MSSTDIGPGMTKAEWDNKFWEKNFLPFHHERPHTRLVQFYDSTYGSRPSKRIFVPLCGKTLVMIWLEGKGHEVVGLEFSSIAVNAFFAENDIDYEKSSEGKFDIYKAKDRNITVFHGDIMDASEAILGKFDAVWDRASFTSMYPIGNQRRRYLQFMSSIARNKDLVYLMSVLEFDCDHDGSPYSIAFETLSKVCEELFEPKELCRNDYDDSYIKGALQEVIYDMKVILIRVNEVTDHGRVK